MDDTNKELSPGQKFANKALTFAIGGIIIQIANTYIQFSGLLGIAFPVFMIFAEIMAVRYAKKALATNDSSVMTKAKWAQGIAYVILGLVAFGILAIPFLIFIDVSLALSLIVGIGTILLLGVIFIFINKKSWSKKKTMHWVSAVVVSAIFVALYFTWLNSLDGNKQSVKLFSPEHWKILSERVGVSTESSETLSIFSTFQEKYEITASLNKKLNSKLLDSQLFEGSSSEIHQRFTVIQNIAKELRVAIDDLNPVVFEILAKYSDRLADADKSNILLLIKLGEIQERRIAKILEYSDFVLLLDFNQSLSNEEKQKLSTFVKELQNLDTELSQVTK
jgi:hypothetical protein